MNAYEKRIIAKLSSCANGLNVALEYLAVLTEEETHMIATGFQKSRQRKTELKNINAMLSEALEILNDAQGQIGHLP